MIKFIQSHINGSFRLIAVALAILTTFTAMGLILSSTLADTGDIPVVLEAPGGISAAYTMEVGQIRYLTVGNLNQARSGDTSIATVGYNRDLLNDNVYTTGVKAGIVTVAYGTRVGVLNTARYQITDSRNISSYTLTNNGEVKFTGASDSPKPIPIKDIVGSNPNIAWSSLNTTVATVNAGSGSITPVGDGAAIILGKFVDKWGVAQEIHVTAIVGDLGGDRLARLIELIEQGDEILGQDPPNYTDESLDVLREAVRRGKIVRDNQNRTYQQIEDAIKELEDALDNLESIIYIDSHGNHYRKVAPHVWEKLNPDNSSKVPPEYVYNENDTPGDGHDRPAYPYGDHRFLVEDPPGSNIWKYVDQDDGHLIDSPAIWGGPDGKPGGGDDEEVTKFGDDYWVHMGQNVWRKVVKSNPRGPLGPLTGGGPDGDPSTDPVLEIFDNTTIDGRYYVGPLGPDEYDNDFYYGDPKTGGNGTLDSTAGGLEKDDVIYYRNPDGTMTTTRPVKPIVDEPDVTTGGVLGPDKTGDTVDWIEIARNGDYSLIVRSKYINIHTSSSYLNNPAWQYTAFGSTNNYATSTVKARINDWFNNRAPGSADKLAADARLRQFTVQNNALSKPGSGAGDGGFTDGFSKPSASKLATGEDVAFALSFGEAAHFVSTSYGTTFSGGPYANSVVEAHDNYKKLSTPLDPFGIWLRSKGSNTTFPTASTIYTAPVVDPSHSAGMVYQFHIDPNTTGGLERGLIYPAVWVDRGIFKAPGN